VSDGKWPAAETTAEPDVRRVTAHRLLQDRYQAEVLLGRGGMAAVWRGRDETKKLKALRDKLATLYKEGTLGADGYRTLNRDLDRVAAALG
jgi:hypothetical protein